MTVPPHKLTIKPTTEITPNCHVKPYKVPLHWKKQVEEGLEKDIRLGIIEKVPANTPAIGCHKMVVMSKPGSTKPIITSTTKLYTCDSFHKVKLLRLGLTLI